MRRTALLLVTACIAAAAAAPALAQSYRCSSAAGPYYSDRPCPIDGGTRLGAYGPVPEPPSPRRMVVIPGKAPEYQKYMTPVCASLNDGVRTASARGLSSQAQSELRADYASKCLEDEALARQRWAGEVQQGYRQRVEQRQQAESAARREQAQTQQTVAQCGEMRRIIAAKNERIATLTPGEVGDLRRFEANFAARCQLQPPAQ